MGGLKVYFQSVANQSKNFNIPVSVGLDSGSSLSDEPEYLSAVNLALQNPEIWSKFRRIREYQDVLEHVDFRQGLKYREVILATDPNWLDGFNKLNTLSLIGHPPTYSYKGIGIISPTILRYSKVSLDIKLLFGDISQFSIAEIGVGFGGQAAVLNKLMNANNFTFYDLPEVLRLATKFLREADIEISPKESDGRTPSSGKFDLVISNYAFSELSGSLQQSYLENVILRSERGYITWNDLATRGLGGFTLDELLTKIPGASLMDEIPLTAPNNAIVIWGNN